MKKLFLFLAVVTAIISFSSCSSDDSPNFKISALEIVGAEFPDAFELNETYTIDVSYLRSDDCTFFEGFDVVKENDTIRNIAVIGSIITDDSDCTEITEATKASFKFTVLYSGTYLFKFLTGQNQDGEAEFLEIEVPVN